MSQQVVYNLKENRVHPGTNDTMSVFLAKRLVHHLPGTDLGEFLGVDSWLVPAPRSSRLAEGALWPAKKLADALHGEGIGERVFPCLERHTTVPKSSHAKAGERPKAQLHYETVAANRDLTDQPPPVLTLVDDVVTLGASLLGFASRLHETFPECEIRAFAGARTMGLQADIEELVEPYVGKLQLRPNGWIDREP